MTFKPQFLVNSFEPKEVPSLNSVITRAYQTRIESIHKRETSGITQYIYQNMEHGEVDFSANGSFATVISYGFQNRQNKIIYVNAHAISSQFSAHVTDVTNTGISITCRPISGTGLFSQVSTATIKVFFQTIGTDP